MQKATVFRFSKNQVLQLLREAVAVNPFRKNGFNELYKGLEKLFPPTCTSRTFKDRLTRAMEQYRKERLQKSRVSLIVAGRNYFFGEI